MDLAASFEQFARDFSLTVADDDWSRVRRHFCEDAVREEHALPLISLRHQGIDLILREWQQMVENFDRRFDHRIVTPVGRASATGNRVSLRWVGAYVIERAPALLGEGTEVALYEGDRIKRLETTWTQETIARNIQWATEHGNKLPGLLEYAATLAPPNS